MRGVLDDNEKAGKEGTGWAVSGRIGVAHQADIGFAEPLDFEKETEITLLMVQNYGGQHTLGRFRLSALTGPTILAVPERVRQALAKPSGEREPGDNEVVLRHVERLDAKTAPLIAEASAHSAKRPAAPEMEVRVISERVADRRTTHVLKRGEFKDLLDEVDP